MPRKIGGITWKFFRHHKKSVATEIFQRNGKFAWIRKTAHVDYNQYYALNIQQLVISLAETIVWEYEKLALDELASLPGGHWHKLLATSFSYPRHMNVGDHPPSLLPSGLNSNSVYSY